MTALVQRFGQLLSQGKYADAYNCFDARFKERVPETQFEEFFTKGFVPRFGMVKEFKSNGIYDIQESPDDTGGMRMAISVALVTAERVSPAQALRPNVAFRFSADEWKIFNLPDWFPADQKPKAGAQKPQ